MEKVYARDVYGKTLVELGKKDKRIVVMDADLSGSTRTSFFSKEFPDRFFNFGVAEQNMMGAAVGLSLTGRKVFTYSIGNFPTLRCLEQLRNDACYHQANVTVVVIGTGFSYGALGFSHHATDDLSILRALPGITVVTPGDLWEVAEATSALAKIPGTSCLRLDKSYAGTTGRDGEEFHIGRPRRLRDGDGVTLITCGGILEEVLAAADELAEHGIESRVLSLHTIKPIAEAEILSAARETGGIVTVEEHVIQGGLGGAVAELCLESEVRPRRFRRLGLDDEFSTVVGSQTWLRRRFGLDAASISKSVRDLLG